MIKIPAISAARFKGYNCLATDFICIFQWRKGFRSHQDQLLFEVVFLAAPDRQETVTLKAMCGPGDNGEPVLTVTFPNED